MAAVTSCFSLSADCKFLGCAAVISFLQPSVKPCSRPCNTKFVAFWFGCFKSFCLSLLMLIGVVGLFGRGTNGITALLVVLEPGAFGCGVAR